MYLLYVEYTDGFTKTEHSNSIPDMLSAIAIYYNTPDFKSAEIFDPEFKTVCYIRKRTDAA